jgi:hypothetical protein
MASFGSRQIPFEINMPSKKIEVLPLPEEGKPANFTGAIGSFSLDSVTVEPDALTVGEPCTIFVKIVGIGNFPRIQEPKLDAKDDWKTYKAKSSFTDESNGLSNIGIKTFEYTVVPRKPDIPYAPEVLFNYFDPIAKRYVEVKSNPVPVSVAPTGRSKRVKENEEVTVMFYQGNAFSIEPPLTVELLITQSEPGVKGNTATGATKPATLETGAVVQVPLFVEQGEVIKVDTRSGEYLSRA